MAPTYAATQGGPEQCSRSRWDIRMAQYGVKVTLVSPGFIDTP